MSRFLPTSLKTEIEKPQGGQGTVWLLELTIDRGSETTPPVIARLCDGNQELQWPLGDPDTPTWYPFPFTFSPVEQTNEGDLTQVQVTIDNSTRMLMRWLHAGGGFDLGQVNNAAIGAQRFRHRKEARYDAHAGWQPACRFSHGHGILPCGGARKKTTA